jgi:hypothetical protein
MLGTEKGVYGANFAGNSYDGVPNEPHAASHVIAGSSYGFLPEDFSQGVNIDDIGVAFAVGEAFGVGPAHEEEASILEAVGVGQLFIAFGAVSGMPDHFTLSVYPKHPEIRIVTVSPQQSILRTGITS